MSVQHHAYPPDWPAISRAIRSRAGNRCEFCGAENGRPHPNTGSRVILTVAHLDHHPANCDPSNLRALCQRCHLRYDAQQHARNARATRLRQHHAARAAAGQLELDTLGDAMG